MCACMCAWPRAASGTCSQQPGKPHPIGIRWGRGHRAVSTQRPAPCSLHGGLLRQDQGSGRVERRVEPRVGPEAVPTAGDVGRAEPTWRRACPTNTPEEEGAVFLSSSQTMVCHSVCPAHPPAPQTPGATATVNQAAGQWAAGPASGPGRTYYSSP